MNWGNKIVIAFLLFTTMIVTMVVISMSNDVGLVAKDYYKEEIDYQQQIDRITNYNELINKPVINLQKGSNRIEVVFPNDLSDQKITGKLVFFRPSTTRLDKEVKLNLDNVGKQYIDISTLPSGRWKMKLTWKGTEKEFYNEVALTF